MTKLPVLIASIVACACAALGVHAQVTTHRFGSGANTFTMDFVTVGTPNNPADTTGYGAVSYPYCISKYEVSERMIDKANASGDLSITKDTRGANKPATMITWFEAARFVNWLNTSAGHSPAYRFDVSGNFLPWSSAEAWQEGGVNLYRHKAAFYFLPGENEWYKAAYFSPAANGYRSHATENGLLPDAVLAGTAPNTAVYQTPLIVPTGPADIDNAGGLNIQGTMAQGGNVWEWTESDDDGVNDGTADRRTYRGASYIDPRQFLSVAGRDSTTPYNEGPNVGFRVSCRAETPPELRQGLVAWYRFDGDATDSSGQAHHGSAEGPRATEDQCGASNRALQFDGIDDVVTVAASAADPADSPAGFAITAWVKADDLFYGGENRVRPVIFKRKFEGRAFVPQFLLNCDGRGNDNSAGFFLASTAARPGEEAADGREFIYSASQTVDVGRWTHLAGVYDAGTQVMKLYLNGSLAQAAVHSSLPSATSAFDILIGKTSYGDHFHGAMDEVRIYRRSLTDQEILQIMHYPEDSQPLDTDVPHVQILEPAATVVVRTTSLAVTAAISDASATLVSSVPPGVSEELEVGGGMITGAVPLDLEGPNVVTISARDAFGNVGGTSVEVIRDTIAPAVMVAAPAPGVVVGAAPVPLTVEILDATATTVEVDGVATVVPAGGGSATLEVPLVPGLNELLIAVTDAAGNRTEVSRTVALDLLAPSVVIEAPSEGQRYGPSARSAQVVVRVEDLAATTVVWMPSGISQALPPGGGTAAATVGLVEGLNTLQVTATDETGRSASAAVSVVLDTTPPTLAFAAPQPGSAVRGVVDLHFVADDPPPGSGVGSVTLAIDGTPLSTLITVPFETALDTTALADGLHTVTAVAADGLGNQSAGASLTVAVDNSPPVLMITAPTEGALISGVTPFQVEVSDSTSGLIAATMRVGGVAPAADGSRTYLTPIAVDLLEGTEDTTRWPDGPITFSVGAQDAAGNTAEVMTTAFADNTRPSRDLVRPRDGDVVSGVITIEAMATDSHLAGLAVFVDGTQVGSSLSSPLIVAFDTTARLDGTMIVELRVADTAGNSSTCVARVTVANIGYSLNPSLLHLKSKGGGGAPLTAEVLGPNLALLLPTERHTIVLRVPGGNLVPADAAWDGDDAVSGPDGTRLRIRFPRASLIASIRAGIDAGAIDPGAGQVTVTLEVDGLVQGTTVLAFVEGK